MRAEFETGAIECVPVSSGFPSCGGKHARGRVLSNSMAGFVRTTVASFSLTAPRDWRYLDTSRGAGPLVFVFVGEAVSAIDVAHRRPAAR